MSEYVYKFIDQNGVVQSTLVMNFSSDDAACEVANDILSHSNLARVEVLTGKKTIFQAARGAAGAVRPNGEATSP